MQYDFYPRPPRGGRRSCWAPLAAMGSNFYPRPPRGGRPSPVEAPATLCSISIHVPRVGDDVDEDGPEVIRRISIHVPRVGDDVGIQRRAKALHGDFYPRPPRGGRRGSAAGPAPAAPHFYPRPPRGGRPDHEYGVSGRTEFLSTSPAWGTTRSTRPIFSRIIISIHVPRVGDDHRAGYQPAVQPIFLSTSPAWGTTEPYFFHGISHGISIHVPRVGDDRGRGGSVFSLVISIHVPRVGDDTDSVGGIVNAVKFLSTSPAWGTTYLSLSNTI